MIRIVFLDRCMGNEQILLMTIVKKITEESFNKVSLMV